MKIRTIIADDEPMARKRLRRFLGQQSDAEIVAECGDGRVVSVLEGIGGGAEDARRV